MLCFMSFDTYKLKALTLQQDSEKELEIYTI